MIKLADLQSQLKLLYSKLHRKGEPMPKGKRDSAMRQAIIESAQHIVHLSQIMEVAAKEDRDSYIIVGEKSLQSLRQIEFECADLRTKVRRMLSD